MTHAKRTSIDLSTPFLEYPIDTAVEVLDPRGRCSGTYTIAGKRRVTRGKRAGMYELTLAPTADHPTLISTRVFVHLGKPSKFLREARPVTDRTAKKAVERLQERTLQKQDIKAKQADKRVSKLDELDIQRGSRVLVRYRDFPREERVVKVNARTGKFAIECFRNKSGLRWMSPSVVIRNLDVES